MIVTIDGPAGAGKSSAARELANRLGFAFLDTGALFRAVTLAALRAGIEKGDESALARLMARLQVQTRGEVVLLDGRDVSDEIRSSAVTTASSWVADSPAVRQGLVELQRRLADGRDLVCEGRDQGTVVFPGAACKFFLSADPAERARRRQREMAARGEPRDLADILRAQEERDRHDARRLLAPMVPAADAIMLDSTHLGLDQVVERMEQEVRRCSTGSGLPGTR